MIEIGATLAAIAAGLFWLVIRLVRSNARTDAAFDQAVEDMEDRERADRAAAEEANLGGDDDAIRERLRRRNDIKRGL